MFSAVDSLAWLWEAWIQLRAAGLRIAVSSGLLGVQRFWFDPQTNLCVVPQSLEQRGAFWLKDVWGVEPFEPIEPHSFAVESVWVNCYADRVTLLGLEIIATYEADQVLTPGEALALIARRKFKHLRASERAQALTDSIWWDDGA